MSVIPAHRVRVIVSPKIKNDVMTVSAYPMLKSGYIAERSMVARAISQNARPKISVIKPKIIQKFVKIAFEFKNSSLTPGDK